ncbi:glycosyltransferase [Clostridium sp. DSM 100503]|uniref:glycosyltransferase n=1 Tax=Clostridium sp. DSM 100503 TaxID=2963282 RepID=UPI002149D5C1|nr:glycosyltransferase [Clostridium sp. DSM 100503]MCR1951283.1 glycosyltransferase [Clostridium sp. DSM 100503]
MSKKIGMFVWNHFTNDARVLRECTALAEMGYDVKLIAIHDKKQEGLKKKEYRDGFNIVRVNRYPKYILLINKIINKIKKNKIFTIPLLTLIGLLFYFSKIIGLAVVLLILLMSLKKVRVFLIKVHIFLNMIIEGVKFDADIYHSNDLNTLPQGIICSKILKRRYLVYDSHEVQSSRTGYGKQIYYLEKILIKFIDKMIMTTRTRAEYVKELYNIELPAVIHNYPFYTKDDSIENKCDLYTMLDIPKDKPILLYQGGIQVGRGLDKIVESIDKFNDGITVFIGDGKLKSEIMKMVEERNLNEKVRFLNKVPVDELKYYTANAYLGFQVLNNVCFNHYSACSNKLFEYMMSKVPIIACDFPEIKRIVKEEQIGIVIDSHNPNEIAEAVNTLLENKELHAMFKENCVEAREKYNWNNEKEKFVKIYDSLLYKQDINVERDTSIGV